MMRPIYLILMFRSIRLNFLLYCRVIVDTLPMVSFIALYIMYFSWVGYTMF
jgi:hypothetical protein